MPPAWESRCNRPGFSRATPDRRAEGNPTDQCHKSRGKLIDPRVRNNKKKKRKEISLNTTTSLRLNSLKPTLFCLSV